MIKTSLNIIRKDMPTVIINQYLYDEFSKLYIENIDKDTEKHRLWNCNYPEGIKKGNDTIQYIQDLDKSSRLRLFKRRNSNGIKDWFWLPSSILL